MNQASLFGVTETARTKTKTILAVLRLALGAVIALPAGAQDVLPCPQAPYKGKIGRTGVITEMGTGDPGDNSPMSKSCGTIGEMLKQNGWNTSWFDWLFQ